MRMWMVNPQTMCRTHLLGEHGEIHKFRHVFVRGYSVRGRKGQIEPSSMGRRHDELALEMVRRGYRHESPYHQPDLIGYIEEQGWKVNVEEAREELHRRCAECRGGGL